MRQVPFKDERPGLYPIDVHNDEESMTFFAEKTWLLVKCGQQESWPDSIKHEVLAKIKEQMIEWADNGLFAYVPAPKETDESDE